MTTIELAKELETKQRAHRLEARQRLWHPTATPASSIGYRCERRLVYLRTMPEAAAPISEELASIFAEGDLHHTDIRRELVELGYEVVDQESQFEDKRLDLKGNIDGRIRIDRRRVPFEAKSTQGDSPSTQAEWADRSGLLFRYYSQLQLYLYLTAEPDGLGLFKDKGTGLWTVVAVEFDYDFVETMLKRAERVRDAVAAGELPERIPDRSECPGCPFLTTCLPADAPVDPLLLAEDAELLQQLEERAQCQTPAKTFDKVDKLVKTRFKLTKGDRFAVGDRFLVSKKARRDGVILVSIEDLKQPE